MACRLITTKPLSEPMLLCFQLYPKEHISVKFYLKFKSFHSRKCTWKCRLENGAIMSRPQYVNKWGSPLHDGVYTVYSKVLDWSVYIISYMCKKMFIVQCIVYKKIIKIFCILVLCEMEFMIFTIMNKYVDFLLVIEFALIIFIYNCHTAYHDVKKTQTTQCHIVDGINNDLAQNRRHVFN